MQHSNDRRASQKDSRSSSRFRLVNSGQPRSPCGLRTHGHASAPQLCSCSTSGHAPVELPVTSGLLLSEEVAQRRPSCFVHVPEHQQGAAMRRALSGRASWPRRCQTHSGSRLSVSEALLLANATASGNAHSTVAHTTKSRSMVSQSRCHRSSQPQQAKRALRS